ncbi:hypothetical protein [Amphibiibacter pelophylacis]|uniref:Uncharacterized protein n=1 Tax=Amphibiibacter pelophylacis TaxID=1799477 RepID=A0ACC6P3F1_9BURK
MTQHTNKIVAAALLSLAGLYSANASAALVTDAHGNTGYDTMEECTAAVQSGAAKFYKSFTHKPALRRAGEVRVQKMELSKSPIGVAAGNIAGMCDKGAAHKLGRDGVSKVLQGKYVPYGPDMMVNVYYNRAGKAVRVTMEQCDNWFSGNLPAGFVKASAPVAAAPAAPAAPAMMAAPAAPAMAAAAPIVRQVAPAAPASAVAGISTPALIGLGVVAAGVAAAVVNSSTTSHH